MKSTPGEVCAEPFSGSGTGNGEEVAMSSQLSLGGLRKAFGIPYVYATLRNARCWRR